jgi:hypothetical protein
MPASEVVTGMIIPGGVSRAKDLTTDMTAPEDKRERGGCGDGRNNARDGRSAARFTGRDAGRDECIER